MHAKSTKFMMAKIALCEPPTTAIVVGLLLSVGIDSCSILGLRTVSRSSSLMVVLSAPPAIAAGSEDDFGAEPVQRMSRDVYSSMLDDGSDDRIRTAHRDF